MDSGSAGAAFENVLISRGLLSVSALEDAGRIASNGGMGLVAAVRRLGLIGDAELATAVSEHYRITLVTPEEWRNPQASEPGRGAQSLLGEALSTRYLREHLMVPVAGDDRRLVLAVADPGHTAAIDAVRLACGRTIELRVAAGGDIEAAIDRLRAAESAAGATGSGSPGPSSDAFAGLETVGPSDREDVQQLKDLALGAPVVEFVNTLLLDALHARATDIHIETFRDRLAIRFRIDGYLGEVRSVSAQQSRAVVSRLKILSGLDIAERRLPQDGRVRLRIDGRALDLRVATMPTIHGETVALRLLESSQRALDLGRLGFGAREEQLVRKHLAAPHGLMLVTGPTGSGKTTTLASALTILNQPHRKIFTVEDPIEYQLDGVNQVQAKPDIDLTFARVLRAFLRHDPDVLMVGEMRDSDTAQTAVHAALTGHLVLSTLHTNSAAGAITRLLDMGVDGYLLASCLTCVVAQRLVRVVCANCRADANGRARGCERCHGTGYLGRTCIVEAFEVVDEIRRLIRPGIDTNEIAAAAARQGMTTMAEDGRRKARAGVTTLEEVRRVTLEG